MEQEPSKIVDQSSASYLSLKAELLRKRQDIQITGSSSLPSSSSSILDVLQSSSSALKLKTKPDSDLEVVNPSKRKKKEETTVVPPPPSSSSSTLSREEELAFAKSRAVLEAKSKLYDKMMTDNEMRSFDDDNDEDKSFLVDFERKVYETNQHLDDNKVEYTDTFGRTRRVTREEFQRFTTADQKTKKPIVEDKRSENEIDRVERLHREQMRAKWQADMEELRNKTHVHYQDILFDEKREHGIGFYKFSTDEKQRQEEMERLNDLRENTKIEQIKIANEKDKRQDMMADRLNRMRQRKAKEMGITLSSNENPPALIETDEKTKEPTMIDHILEQASIVVQENNNNDNDDNEDEQRKKLDAAKKLLFPSATATSFTEVVDELRNERRQEFCPIYTDDNPEEIARRLANQKPVGSLLAKRIRWDELKRQREAEERRAQQQHHYGPMYANQTQSQSFANPYDQYYSDMQYQQMLNVNANQRAQQEHSGFWPQQETSLQNNSQIAQNSLHEQASPYTYPFPKTRANNNPSESTAYFTGTLQPPPPPPDEPYPY